MSASSSTKATIMEKGAKKAKMWKRRVKKKRRLRVGFISSFVSPESSVWGSFGHTINQLQQRGDELGLRVHLIYFPRLVSLVVCIPHHQSAAAAG